VTFSGKALDKTPFYSYTIGKMAKMDSLNLSQHPELRAARSADEDLMLLLVLLCNSEGSQAATSSIEFEANLFFGQNNQRNLGLAITKPPTEVRLQRPA